VGEVQVKRKLTALVPGMYRPHVELPGFSVDVEPNALNFAKAGQTREVTLTIRNESAAVGQFTTGTLTWKGPRTVTSPIAVRPVDARIAPSFSFSSATGTGSGTIDLVSGSDAPLAVAVEGLAPMSQTAISKTPGAYAPTNDAHNALLSVTVPAGATFARIGVQSERNDVDWDMVVYAPDASGRLVAKQVATPSASEFLELESPQAGTYFIVANLYSTPDKGAAAATVQAAALSGDAGNLTVNPNPIVAPNGTATSATLNWTGLAEGSYLSRLKLGENGIKTLVNVRVGTGTPAPPAGAPLMAPADRIPAG
jgi:hypothetical protein